MSKLPSWDIVFTSRCHTHTAHIHTQILCLHTLYSMWYTYIPNMRSVQVSLLEISCLQGFHNLTHVDPKWPLTSTKNNWLLVLNVVHLHTKYEICPSFPSWDIVFTRFSQFDPCWPQMTFDLHQKQSRVLVLNVVHLHTKYEICPSFTSSDMCLQAGARTSPLLTANDLWPPPKTIEFLYSMWYTYIPNMRSVQVSLLEILCLQGFHNLTPVDPKWPLTSTKINRVLVLNMVHLNTKYEICPSSPSWDIVFTSGRHTHTHTHTHIHTHTHTRIHTYIHTYGSMITKVTTSSKPKIRLESKLETSVTKFQLESTINRIKDIHIYITYQVSTWVWLPEAWLEQLHLCLMCFLHYSILCPVEQIQIVGVIKIPEQSYCFKSNYACVWW